MPHVIIVTRSERSYVVEKTMGQAAREAAQIGEQLTAREIQEAAQKEHRDNIIKIIEQDKDKYEGDFFIVVSARREKILSNVIRNQIWTRESCPTPTYDQQLYRYNAKDEELSFVWCVPDKQAAHYLKSMPLHELSYNQRLLLDEAIKFYNGTLYHLMKQFNHEHDGPGCALKDKKHKQARGISLTDKE